MIVAFAQGKFYLLFAFLFGYSLSLMLRGRGPESRAGLRRYRRRLVGLFAIGLAHALLFFVGDILISYALLGLVLIWFVPRSDRTALRAAGVALVVGVMVLVAVALSAVEQPAAGFVPSAATFDVAMQGSFVDAVVARAQALPEVLLVLGALNWAFALAMFLLGLVAGRRGVLARPQDFGTLWRRLLVLGLVIGVPGGLLSALLAHGPGRPTDLREVMAVAVGFATAPALTAGYIALAARAVRSRPLAAMAPAGRMSLTGYLGESILLSAIFCGWGLGLFGELGAFTAALVALAVWFAMKFFASWWLRHCEYGPFEWVLRAWSYRTWPPLRREQRIALISSRPGRS